MEMKPEISVIMPVYNSGKYLHKAIDSILSQTHVHFEFIIINDCSTDNSEEIILSYVDRRISYYKFKYNKGVVAASNFALQLANSEYTCVMHSDDIANPYRLEKQKKFLDAHKGVSAVFSFITFINEQDDIIGYWKEDQLNDTAKKIKRTMPWVNCIAHPTAMIRTAIYKKYGYRFNQQSQEDYDLWMRVLADNLIIEKISEPLLFYRVHKESITGTILRRSNPFFKQLDCKTKFLFYQIRNFKWGWFETMCLFGALHDMIMGLGKNIKSKISNV